MHLEPVVQMVVRAYGIIKSAFLSRKYQTVAVAQRQVAVAAQHRLKIA